MTAPLVLHYAPDNASLCVRLALEEVGAPYQSVLVDRAARGQKAPAYLRLNPNGLIPVLETPDGPIFETAAILLWLADRHPGLMPGGPERAKALTWLIWLSNTLHPALRMLFYPGAYAPEDPPGLRRATQARIPDLLDILEASDAPFRHAGRPTALACYAAPMLRWMALYPPGDTAWFDLARWPRLHQLARDMDARPSARAAISAEGLGDTPFSAPVLPSPPEGSAL